MKKIIALFIAAFCMFSALTFSVYASPVNTEMAVAEELDNGDRSAEFTEDFNKFFYEEFGYTRFNDNNLTGDITTYTVKIKLNDNQQQILSGLNIDISYEKDIIYANYEFKNGGRMSFAYLRDEYVESYNDAMTNNWQSAIIDFYWPEENTLTVSKDALKQEKTNLFIGKYYPDYDVYAPIGGQNYGIKKGTLYIDGEDYYYIDFADAGIVYQDGFNINDYSNVVAYKISDNELYSQIKSCIQRNHNEDLGFFEDDKFTARVADVFLIIIFAIIPFAIFLLFLILALRSKTKYKKYFSAISILALAEIVIFVVLVVLFIVLKV